MSTAKPNATRAGEISSWNSSAGDSVEARDVFSFAQAEARLDMAGGDLQLATERWVAEAPVVGLAVRTHSLPSMAKVSEAVRKEAQDVEDAERALAQAVEKAHNPDIFWGDATQPEGVGERAAAVESARKELAREQQEAEDARRSAAPPEGECSNSWIGLWLLPGL